MFDIKHLHIRNQTRCLILSIYIRNQTRCLILSILSIQLLIPYINIAASTTFNEYGLFWSRFENHTRPPPHSFSYLYLDRTAIPLNPNFHCHNFFFKQNSELFLTNCLKFRKEQKLACNVQKYYKIMKWV